ncbi:MAG: hypothetical protein AAGJ84_15890 [Pseudomonadota bacterium]
MVDTAFWKRCHQSVALARGADWPIIHIVPPEFDDTANLELAIRVLRDEPILTPPRCGRFEWPSLSLHLRATPLERVQLAGHFEPDDLLTILVQCNARRLPVRVGPESFRTSIHENDAESVISFLSNAADFAFVDTPLSIASGA